MWMLVKQMIDLYNYSHWGSLMGLVLPAGGEFASIPVIPSVLKPFCEWNLEFFITSYKAPW